MHERLKFIADERFDKEILLALREDYNVSYVIEFMPSTKDADILKRAEKEQRIVLTLDKDFGELVFRANKNSFRRYSMQSTRFTGERKCSLVKTIIVKYRDELFNAFAVI